MKVVAITRRGGPSALETLERPLPEPGRGEIRLRVRAAGINPVDVMLRDGTLAGEHHSVIPGMDVAGIVDAIGPDMWTPLKIGDRATGIVTGNSSEHGGYAEYVVLRAESVTAAPRGKSFAESAAFLMPALTARHALDALDASPGSTVLITGAAGAVGGSAVSLAKAGGLQVIALASATDELRVHRYGADVFLARGEDVAARLHAIAPNGVDAVIETAGLRDAIFPLIRPGGRIVTVSGAQGPAGQRRCDVEVIRILVGDRATDSEAIRGLREAVETGILPVEVAATFPADNAADAHRLFDRGGVRGRIVLLFGDE